MIQTAFDFDICANRHRGNAASRAANRRVAKSEDRELVLGIIKSKGITYSKEIAAIMEKPLHTISGRLSELKALGLIEDTGERVEGCGCVRIKQ